MDNNWATEHLQTIRTLMERSALYRRALAPVMIFNGVLGVACAIVGWILKIESLRGFVLFWATAAFVALLGSFLLVRRQAFKDAEPVWSPPTRRVAQALLPPLVVGMVIGAVCIRGPQHVNPFTQTALGICWMWLYGCALHSAGFFMQRGVKVLGWIFILAGFAIMGWLLALLAQGEELAATPHLVMGGGFGGLHLAYGIYLYFTEKSRNET